MTLCKRSKASVGRADLIEVFFRHGEKYLVMMSEFAGYERVQEMEKMPEQVDGYQRTTPIPPPTSETIHKFVDAGERVKFWHVTQTRKKKAGEVAEQKPSWTRGDTFSDGEIRMNLTKKPPSTLPLVPWSQLWPFLKKALGTTSGQRSIDINKVVEWTAKLKPVLKLPPKKTLYWSPRAHIILDFGERLIPFWGDIHAVYHGIEKLRGHFGLEIYNMDRGPHQLLESIVDFKLPKPGMPLLILSDLGGFEPAGWMTKTWIGFGKRLKKAGLSPVVLTPCPPRFWNKELLSYFRMVRWDRGRKLPKDLSATYHGDSVAAAAENERVERLLTLLSPAIRVEPGLLRAARLLLPIQEADSGTEGMVWNHPHVDRCPLAFMHQEQFLEKYRQAFSREKACIRKQIISLIEKHHAHLSPAIQCEEKIISGTLQGTSCDWAEEFMQKYFRTIDEKSKFRNKEGLKTWFAGLTSRQHSDIWKKNKILTACWFKINCDDWNLGKTRLRQGMTLDDVAWMIESRSQTEHVLFQAGDALVVESKSLLQDQETNKRLTTGSRLAMLTATKPYLEILHQNANDNLSYFFDLSSDHSAKIHFCSTDRFIFNTDSLEIVVENMEIPSWAESIGQDKNGLFVTLESDSEQRITWFNPGSYRTKYDGKHPYDDKETIIHTGFWGNTVNVDRYGLCVDFAIKGINLRMRWIKPGKFMMGSPENEPKRYRDELLHEVILSEGFWFAETACTQELWQAVMGNNPSSFKGKKRPVGNISWNDCKKFIEKLNEIADWGFRFPTEAEWEYACRAGTRTPFSFGNNITTEQVNYDRVGTVEVKSLPCNDWGLYEMHGNVGEWCSDWFGNYKQKSVMDPVGPDSGVRRVLRGGYWLYGARDVRSAYRDGYEPDYRRARSGFRLARGHKKGFSGAETKEKARTGRRSAASHSNSAHEQSKMSNKIEIHSTIPEIFPMPWASDWGEHRKQGLWLSFTCDNIRQCFRWIEPGKFMMGSPENEQGRDDDELLHEVILTKGFWLAETTCTQELWEAVMGNNPSNFKGKKRPVENVNWNDCNRFLDKINKMMPGLELCLPTEAQWEYACRAGTQTPFSFGDNITMNQVNYNENLPDSNGQTEQYREQTVDVKSLPCNDWGLYEMHGNVWEWCSDWFGHYNASTAFDPVGPNTGTDHVLRGGSWFYNARYVRSAYRYCREPIFRSHRIGFRLARSDK